MTEDPQTATATATASAEAGLADLADLADLRRTGRWRADPVRFRYLEALARRIPAQPAAVQQRLRARLAQGLARFAQAPDAALPPVRRAAVKPAPSPLAELVQALRAARPEADIALSGDELASARRFRAAWDTQQALAKLDQALAQRPAQPGPLNSHALVLQSLELMRDASPAYLRQFVLQVESLLWLAGVGGQGGGPQPAAKKAAVKGKAAKPAATRKRRA